MKPLASLFSLVSAFALPVLAAGCIPARPPSVAFDGCWTDGAPTGYVIRTAANEIVGGRDARIRTLAGVPLVVDSVRAHSEPVTDRSVCIRLWGALDSDDRTARLAAVRIGRTFWVRLRHGVEAFDDSYHRLTSVVDLN